MNDLIQFASNTGFAILVAIYSLTRLETTIKNNTDTINQLSKTIAVVNSKNGDLNE